MRTITFETKVWEKDWQLILETNRLADVIARCNHSFDVITLFINNVNDLPRVKAAAQKHVDRA